MVYQFHNMEILQAPGPIDISMPDIPPMLPAVLVAAAAVADVVAIPIMTDTDATEDMADIAMPVIELSDSMSMLCISQETKCRRTE